MAASMDWLRQAACKEAADPEIFFPPPANSRLIIQEAKSYCNRCPVRRECLQHALRTRAKGVWGDMSDIQRAMYRLKLKEVNN